MMDLKDRLGSFMEHISMKLNYFDLFNGYIYGSHFPLINILKYIVFIKKIIPKKTSSMSIL